MSNYTVSIMGLGRVNLVTEVTALDTTQALARALEYFHSAGLASSLPSNPKAWSKITLKFS